MCLVLFVVIIILLLKIVMMKKTAKEISAQFEQILKTDTNKIITISGNDKEMKKLADIENSAERISPV